MLCLSMSLSSQTFTNMTSLLNNTGGGQPCIVDMNGDGLDDVVTFSGSSNSYDMYIDYQQPDGTFDVAFFNANFSRRPSWSICAGDLDQNGYNDLMVGSGDRVIFIKANDTGTAYTEQFINDYIFSQRTNMVDIDNDGDLDAFACHDVDLSHPYRNDGSGNMTEDQNLIATVPLAGNYASVWTDFDNDGDTDMYISKCRQGSSTGDVQRENMLYVNDGSMNYVKDSTNIYGLFDNEQSWVTLFEDFDNDGDLDTYTVNHTGQNYLRENDGVGHYTEITAGSGIDADDLDSWHLTSADFDNDGLIDILTQTYADKSFYHNDGNMQFTAVDFDFDRGALGDLNNDGFIDVFTGNTLWMNDGNDNHWIKVGLEGTTSNSNGIGARLELHGAWGIQIRECRSGEDFNPMNSLDEIIGIGAATSIDSLVVKWPSGQRDVVYDPAIDAKIVVQETPLASNLRLVAVDPSTKNVTIKNFGNASQDISDYRLCSNINYTFSGIAANTVLVSGDLDLSPGEEVTVNWLVLGAFRSIGDDMGLYLPEGSFPNPSAMVDYMQYLTLDGGREAVAVAKGIWSNDETVMDEPEYTYIGDGTQNGASFWEGIPASCDPGGAPVDLTKSFDPVNGIQDRVQVKWFKAVPQVKYSDEDAVACDIKFWPKRDLNPITGNPVGPAYSNPDTTLIEDAKKFYPDGITPREIFKWPVKFRADGVNNSNRAEPNIRYEWKVRCACDHGLGAETPWSAIKLFNTPDFDPVTGIYTSSGGFAENEAELKMLENGLADLVVFPNPTNGILNIRTDAIMDMQLNLIDITGRTIFFDKMSSDKDSRSTVLDLTALPSGIYMLSITDGISVETVRVFKK